MSTDTYPRIEIVTKLETFASESEAMAARSVAAGLFPGFLGCRLAREAGGTWRGRSFFLADGAPAGDLLMVPAGVVEYIRELCLDDVDHFRAATVSFQLASGDVVSAVRVHGAGGSIARVMGYQYFDGLCSAATEGRPLASYEPKPGHVLVYRSTAHDARLQERAVDLRGATLIEWEPPVYSLEGGAPSPLSEILSANVGVLDPGDVQAMKTLRRGEAIRLAGSKAAVRRSE